MADTDHRSWRVGESYQSQTCHSFGLSANGDTGDAGLKCLLYRQEGRTGVESSRVVKNPLKQSSFPAALGLGYHGFRKVEETFPASSKG